MPPPKRRGKHPPRHKQAQPTGHHNNGFIQEGHFQMSNIPFSMKDTVRSTKQYSNSHGMDGKFRFKTIGFVSAGSFDPNDLLNEVSPKSSSETALDPAANQPNLHEAQQLPEPAEDTVSNTPMGRVEDSLSNFKSLSVRLKPDSTASSSHMDVHTSAVQMDNGPVSVRAPSPCSSDSSGGVSLTSVKKDAEVAQPSAIIASMDQDTGNRPDTTPATDTRSKWAVRTAPVLYFDDPSDPEVGNQSNPQESILDDYLANLKENGELSDFLTANDAPAAVAPRSKRRKRGKNNSESVKDGWTPSDLDDFDNVDSPESQNEIDQVLSKRRRKGRTQYLVVYEGDDAEDAKWLPGDVIEASSEANKASVDHFEKMLLDRPGLSDNGSNESADFSSEEDDDSDEPTVKTTYLDQFVIDENLEDMFNMSPRRKKKSAYERFWNIDGDLESQLQATWKKDRQTKVERKREREALRAQGLLGSNKKKKKGKDVVLPDLKAKYPQVMRVEHVRNELKTFLESGLEQFAMPPMATFHRKLVHEFANKAGLKSKSRGDGNSRHTVLYRTSKTVDVSMIDFSVVSGRMLGRMPRLDKGPRAGRPPGVGSKGGSSRAYHYQDGDVVGAEAPKLSTDSRGHAMMAKMGWSYGIALGAVDNKGMLDPLSHTVKTSKAGLG